MRLFKQSLALLLILSLVGCAQNPVTERRELNWIPQDKEIHLGENHYAYGQQQGGGVYQAEPTLSKYINEVGQKLAKQSHRPDLPFEFVILNDTIPNAWAMPGGKIAVNRGLLLELDNEAELAAVLGHEITHATARHGAKDMQRQMMMAAAMIATNVYMQVKHQDPLATNAAMAGGAVATELVSKKYSRGAELEADNYGIDTMVKAGYDPMAAVKLQETFIRLNDQKSSRWGQGLFASHPPSEARRQANLKKAQVMPKDLSLNQGVYQQQIAKLKTKKPAFEALEAGEKALKAKNYEAALTYAEKAIAVDSSDGMDYALKVDVYAKQNKRQQALNAYNQAIAKNNGYYAFYLKRGLLHKKMKQYQLAKKDLYQSQALMPTQAAERALRTL